MADADALTLLRREAAATSQAAAARRIGISPTAVSQLLSGKYPAKDLAPMLRRIASALDGTDCPHLGRRLAGEDCRSYRTRPMPRSDAAALRHWGACQTCQHNQRAGGAVTAHDRTRTGGPDVARR